MTLARTALRLAVVNALTGTDDNRPTMAANRIYDSRNDEIEPDAFDADALPIIIVMTDEDQGQQLSENNGGPPFRRWIDVTIEMGMLVKDTVDGAFAVGYPNTDARLEASLDLLEYQVMRRLGADPAPAAELFRRIARIRQTDSHRRVDTDANVKLAARVMKLQCDCGDDDEPVFNSEIDDIPSGEAALPDPLRTIAASLPAGSSGLDIAAGIAAALSPLTTGPLAGVDFQVDANPDDDEESGLLDVSIEISAALQVPETVAVGQPVTIDYAKGTFQRIILAADVSTMSIIHWPRAGKTGRLILQVTNAGNFTIDGWPDGTIWTGGGLPLITQGAGKRDIFVLTGVDGGVSFFGNVAGQDYH